MRDFYNEKYPRKVKGELKPVSSEAFTMAMRRMGISADARIELKYEAEKEQELKDIMDYEEVKGYLYQAKYVSHIGRAQRRSTKRNLRRLFRWMVDMGFPNPRDWNIKNLGKCMEKHIGLDENGQWKNNDKVLHLWGAFNRCFEGKLSKGWSMGLKRPAGELKDFFEFEEFNRFNDALEDRKEMSREGWETLYKAEVNSGARGGTKGKQGIVSLRWENIDYNARRCKLRDKGKKGKPARLWVQIPLDLFPWIHGWEALMKWHEQRYGYRPTQDRHGSGEVFTVTYQQYRDQFHKTRKKAGGRISQDLETMKPHIFRKTHGQWCKRIGVTLENLCGDTTASPNVGRYGVGWDDPKVPLKYYLTKEPWEYEEQDKIIEKRLGKLEVASPQPPVLRSS
jgi:integrase